MKRKTFTKDDKLAVVHELELGKPIAQVCREHGINENVAHRWRREYQKDPLNAFAGKGNASTLEAKYAQSERMIGQLALENDFLKKALNTLQAKLAEVRNGR